MNFLKNIYEIIKELESAGDNLSTFIKRREEMTKEPHHNWDAHAVFHMTEILNNTQYLKNRIIEFDNAINSVDDFWRDSRERLRKELLS